MIYCPDIYNFMQKEYIKRIIRYVTGISFLILGVIGLFLPILQGILFIITGLLILAPESKKIQNLLEKLKKKYPDLYNKVTKKKEKRTSSDSHKS